ncbi:hypothetical protein PRIPAC_94864, partial [Pristionchus pacificus]|uniref:ShK domain-containing protein n=1 Tax=Pristionchus pacificus TaxID=54126 RepID=A0A2A6CED3_PRIPA
IVLPHPARPPPIDPPLIDLPPTYPPIGPPLINHPTDGPPPIDPQPIRRPPIYPSTDPQPTRPPPTYPSIDPQPIRPPPIYTSIDPQPTRPPPTNPPIDPQPIRPPPNHPPIDPQSILPPIFDPQPIDPPPNDSPPIGPPLIDPPPIRPPTYTVDSEDSYLSSSPLRVNTITEQRMRYEEQGRFDRNCNSRELREILVQCIAYSPSESKQRINAAIARRLDGSFGIVCTGGAFSYLARFISYLAHTTQHIIMVSSSAMAALIVSTVLLGLASHAAAQCSTTENANCGSWVRNGFCNNMGYSLSQRQSYCGVSCGLCTPGGVPIVPGGCTADANANCAKWAAEKEFCTKAKFASKKMMYCCKTCAGAGAAAPGSTGSTTTAASTTTTTVP